MNSVYRLTLFSFLISFTFPATLITGTVLDDENLSERYDTLFIGSGDGIFAYPVARLIAQGMNVIAIHSTIGLSKS